MELDSVEGGSSNDSEFGRPDNMAKQSKTTGNSLRPSQNEEAFNGLGDDEIDLSDATTSSPSQNGEATNGSGDDEIDLSDVTTSSPLQNGEATNGSGDDEIDLSDHDLETPTSRFLKQFAEDPTEIEGYEQHSKHSALIYDYDLNKIVDGDSPADGEDNYHARTRLATKYRDIARVNGKNFPFTYLCFVQAK